MTQTLEAQWDSFEDVLWLPRSPVSSITSVKYVAIDGTLTTLSTDYYVADLNTRPARIVPAYNTTWPTTRPVPAAVQVRFVAGYGAANDVPEGIKAALKLYVSHWYENRVPVTQREMAALPMAVDCLLDAYRVRHVR